MNRKDIDALKFIAVVVALCVSVHLINVFTFGALSDFGLLPRHFSHFLGLVSYPFIHGSWAHLISNMVSFTLLGFLVSRSGIARLIAVFLICWFGSGLGVWFFGRMHFHIGLSGVIYGLWAYLLTYAVMYRSIKSIVIATLVMFFYGSMVWGFIPVHEWISYESHLFGALSGIVAGYLFAKRDKKNRSDYVGDV
ncbi:rhomboid family intramembrane serine protease [Photobacterium sanctipauli]|uniref:Rhomboid family intramembrane serine protease n=1 Tax=Photobacterium sanctipauli TaxID=1342794 RepID=A0A2T3NV34_9GAMM|nr:rhomboid family intramembrane serine protease [Photobacterium sanctipauli]PSW20150.1 rhomboid family intramembrane serine protease [Photobacterium sanctipauli]